MIKSKFLGNVPIIKTSGNYVDNLMLLGCTMKDMAETLMLKHGCSYEDAMNFICDLPNKLIYNENGYDITFSVSVVD